jgi:shikimate kinase
MNIDSLKDKRILVVGMAGTGKTFISKFLSNLGLKAFDADEVDGLSGWFDKTGNKVLPKDLSISELKGLEWNWNQEILEDLLKRSQPEGVLLFGVSSNWYKFLNLFDKVFFLDLDGAEIRKRLQSGDRKNDYAKKEPEIQNILEHLEGFRRFALGHGAIPLDAKKTPQEIYIEIVNKTHTI